MSNALQEKLTARPQKTKNTVTSKHRLTEISHHFLSDSNERLPAWQNTYVIPVLLSDKKDDHIVYELDQAFNHQQRSSIVLNIENNLTTEAPLTAKTSEESTLPEFCLIPVTSPSTTLALQSDRLILAAHASLAGVRIAYNQLAFLASLDTNFNICVVMLEAKTTQDAKRYFKFLCDSAQSLLALKLECGGFLLQGGATITTKGSRNNTTDNKNIATDVEGVAKGILQEFTRRDRPHPVAASLSAPTGPAAYLT